MRSECPRLAGRKEHTKEMSKHKTRCSISGSCQVLSSWYTIGGVIKSALARIKNRQSKFWDLLPLLNRCLSSEAEGILKFCDVMLYESEHLPI